VRSALEARKAAAEPHALVRRACSATRKLKSSPNLMEVKGSEAQGVSREIVLMNKNVMRGYWERTSGRVTAKSISIEGPGSRSRGCALEDVELIPGELGSGRKTGRAGRRSEERPSSQQKA
jgi:hypothetical protein